MNIRDKYLECLSKYHGDKYILLCKKAFEYGDEVNSKREFIPPERVKDETNRWFYDDIFEPEMNKILQKQIKEEFPTYGELNPKLLNSLSPEAIFALDELEEFKYFYANTIIYLNYLFTKNKFWSEFDYPQNFDFSGIVLDCVKNAKIGAEEFEREHNGLPNSLMYLNEPFQFVNTQFKSFFDSVREQETRWQEYLKKNPTPKS